MGRRRPLPSGGTSPNVESEAKVIDETYQVAEEVFNRLPQEGLLRYCVSVGSEHAGAYSTTTTLLHEKSGGKGGWFGILLEADSEKFQESKRRHKRLGNRCIHIDVVGENGETALVESLQNYVIELPASFDFLSLDYGGKSFWILNDLWRTGRYYPKLVSVPFYNTGKKDICFIPKRTESIDVHASLGAFRQLTEYHGYELFAVSGSRAFFIPTPILDEFLRDAPARVSRSQTTTAKVPAETSGSHFHQNKAGDKQPTSREGLQEEDLGKTSGPRIQRNERLAKQPTSQEAVQKEASHTVRPSLNSKSATTELKLQQRPGQRKKATDKDVGFKRRRAHHREPPGSLGHENCASQRISRASNFDDVLASKQSGRIDYSSFPWLRELSMSPSKTSEPISTRSFRNDPPGRDMEQEATEMSSVSLRVGSFGGADPPACESSYANSKLRPVRPLIDPSSEEEVRQDHETVASTILTEATHTPDGDEEANNHSLASIHQHSHTSTLFEGMENNRSEEFSVFSQGSCNGIERTVSHEEISDPSMSAPSRKPLPELMPRALAIDVSPICTRKRCDKQMQMQCGDTLVSKITSQGYALVRGTGISRFQCTDIIDASKIFLQDADETVRRSCFSERYCEVGYSPVLAEGGESDGQMDMVKRFRYRKSEANSATIWPDPSAWKDENASYFEESVQDFHNCASEVLAKVVRYVLRRFEGGTESRSTNRNTAVERSIDTKLTLLGTRRGSRHIAQKDLIAPRLPQGLLSLVLIDDGDSAIFQIENEDGSWRDATLPNILPDDPIFILLGGSEMTGTESEWATFSPRFRLIPASGQKPLNVISLTVTLADLKPTLEDEEVGPSQETQTAPNSRHDMPSDQTEKKYKSEILQDGSDSPPQSPMLAESGLPREIRILDDEFLFDGLEAKHQSVLESSLAKLNHWRQSRSIHGLEGDAQVSNGESFQHLVNEIETANQKAMTKLSASKSSLLSQAFYETQEAIVQQAARVSECPHTITNLTGALSLESSAVSDRDDCIDKGASLTPTSIPQRFNSLDRGPQQGIEEVFYLPGSQLDGEDWNKHITSPDEEYDTRLAKLIAAKTDMPVIQNALSFGSQQFLTRERVYASDASPATHINSSTPHPYNFDDEHYSNGKNTSEVQSPSPVPGCSERPIEVGEIGSSNSTPSAALNEQKSFEIDATAQQALDTGKLDKESSFEGRPLGSQELPIVVEDYREECDANEARQESGMWRTDPESSVEHLHTAAADEIVRRGALPQAHISAGFHSQNSSRKGKPVDPPSSEPSLEPAPRGEKGTKNSSNSFGDPLISSSRRNVSVRQSSQSHVSQNFSPSVSRDSNSASGKLPSIQFKSLSKDLQDLDAWLEEAAREIDLDAIHSDSEDRSEKFGYPADSCDATSKSESTRSSAGTNKRDNRRHNITTSYEGLLNDMQEKNTGVMKELLAQDEQDTRFRVTGGASNSDSSVEDDDDEVHFIHNLEASTSVDDVNINDGESVQSSLELNINRVDGAAFFQVNDRERSQHSRKSTLTDLVIPNSWSQASNEQKSSMTSISEMTEEVHRAPLVQCFDDFQYRFHKIQT